MDGVSNIAVAIFSTKATKYSKIPQLSEIMLTSNMVLPDYVCLADVALNHPEPKLSIDSQANGNRTADKSDREIQRLLDSLTSTFSIGINLLNSH